MGVQCLCWEDLLEEEMAIHSSTLAWKIPWTEEPVTIVHTVSKSRTRLKQLSARAPCNANSDDIDLVHRVGFICEGNHGKHLIHTLPGNFFFL